MTAALTLERLVLSRGGRPVIRGVDAVARRGQLTVLVGRNGAGKSTLLEAMAGLVHPDGGRVLLGDADLHTLPRAQVAREVASLGQDERPDDELGALEVALLGRAPHLGPWGLPSGDDVARAERALVSVDAGDLVGRRLRMLSGGERQRALVARILCQDAGIVLLDEPTHALDIRHAGLVMTLFREATRRGAAVVVALHDLTLAARHADAFWVLHEGRLIHAGPLAGDELAARLSTALEAPVQVVAGRSGPLVGPA